MGMIMKDGIPYGGIYPIDDAPTQGSNNAVKSGGVHSDLSNKVDKVAGKGLSTNDYDNAEKEQNEANAEAIEAIVNQYGSKNLLPTVKGGSMNGAIFTVNADGSFTITGNPTAYTSFALYNNLNLKPGQYVLSGIPSGGGADKWGINCEVDGSWLPNSVWQGGATSYSINVSSIINRVTLIVYPKTGEDYNLTFYPMIRDARIKDPTYVPYAMTNRELTKKQMKTLSYYVDLTTNNDGEANSDTLSSLHPGKVVMGCIIDYDFYKPYAVTRATSIFYYQDRIMIRGGIAQANMEFRVHYTLLYHD